MSGRFLFLAPAEALRGPKNPMILAVASKSSAAAMQRIQLTYAHWFHRSRRRDGGLVRGRQGSKPVRSLRQRRVLVHPDENVGVWRSTWLGNARSPHYS